MAKKRVRINSKNDLESCLSNLKSQTYRLNQVTDSVNQTFDLTENYLADCSIGLSVAAECDLELENTESDYDMFIEYIKYQGKFRIVLTSCYQGDYDNGSSVPWEELGRTKKLKLVKALPKLLNKLADEVQILLSDISDAEEAVVEVNKLIKGGF